VAETVTRPAARRWKAAGGVCSTVMADWSDLEHAEPEMAAVGRALLARHQVAYLATIRADGAPRVHHVCPAIIDAAIYVSIGQRSPKLSDLRRDARYMLHFMCGEEDAEFNVRGAATEVLDPDEQRAIRAAADEQGIRYTEHEVLFHLRIDRADSTRWQNFGTPQISPKRSRWLARDLGGE